MITVGVKEMAQGSVLAAQADCSSALLHKCIKIQVCVVAYVQYYTEKGEGRNPW